MTKELEARLISFVSVVAKGCDVCPHKHSSCCVGCYGQEAKALKRDLFFVPWKQELTELDLSVISKLFEDRFSTCSGVASECGMTVSAFACSVARLSKMGIVEVKGRWIKKTATK